MGPKFTRRARGSAPALNIYKFRTYGFPLRAKNNIFAKRREWRKGGRGELMKVDFCKDVWEGWNNGDVYGLAESKSFSEWMEGGRAAV